MVLTGAGAFLHPDVVRIALPLVTLAVSRHQAAPTVSGACTGLYSTQTCYSENYTSHSVIKQLPQVSGACTGLYSIQTCYSENYTSYA